MLLDLGVSSRRIQSFLSHSSGKPLTLRDIHNQRVHLDKINANGQSDIQLLLSTVDYMLKNDPWSDAIYAVNDDNHIRLMFWQTSQMRELYRKFSEVLFVDGTYCVKCTTVRMPLYCILVQNGYGNVRVCAYSLIGHESFQLLYTVLELYKQKKKELSETQLKTVVVDKDFTELAVLQDIFQTPRCKYAHFMYLKPFRQLLQI